MKINNDNTSFGSRIKIITSNSKYVKDPKQRQINYAILDDFNLRLKFKKKVKELSRDAQHKRLDIYI